MILHADLDAFYASVAQREAPNLRGKPLVIAGSSRRAVVLTASYEARQYGIHSAMPLYQARERYPKVIVVAPNFTLYREASSAVFEVFHAHALTVEGLSLDEAFLELGDIALDQAVAVARRIKAAVRERTLLAISIGAASGKMVAKIACDEGKPDGLVAVPVGTEAEYLAKLPVRKLWGIGPKTEKRLSSYGLDHIGDIAALPDERLFTLFGRWGPELRDLARGIDRRQVSESWEARSISSEETFERDVTELGELTRVVKTQAAELAERLQRKHLCAHTVSVKVKQADRRVFGKQTSFVEPVEDAAVISAAAVYCLKHAEIKGPVRLIGVRVTKLVPQGAKQTSFFSRPHD